MPALAEKKRKPADVCGRHRPVYLCPDGEDAFVDAAVVLEEDGAFLETLAVGGGEGAVPAAGQVVGGAAVAVGDAHPVPAVWQHRAEAQDIAFFAEAQKFRQQKVLVPGRAAGVPGPAAPATVPGAGVDIRCHDVRLHPVADGGLLGVGMRLGKQPQGQLPGFVVLAQLIPGRHGPGGGVGVLAAVFPDAGHIGRDVARILRTVKGRG